MSIKAKSPPSELNLTGAAVLDLQSAEGDGATKRPTFKIFAYSGNSMNLGEFFSPVVISLDGIKTDRKQIPILLDHDPSKIIGQATATIDKTGVHLSGVVTGDDSDAQKVVGHAKNGFEWQASVGMRIVRQSFVKAGEKANVNGRDLQGPLVIAHETVLRETSFTSLGADSSTTATVAATSPKTPKKGADSVFESWLKARGIDPETLLDDAVKTTLKAAYDAEVKAKTTTTTTENSGNDFDEVIKAQRDENDRVAAITRITQESISKRRNLLDKFELLARSAIASKKTVAEFELEIMRIRADAGGFSIYSGSSDTGIGSNVLEAALCRAGRLNDIEKHFDAKTLEAADRHFRHGISLMEFLMIGARENGYSGHSASDLKGVLQAAFPQNIRADGFSTINVPGILSNLLSKFLVDFFNSVEQTWRAIVAIRNVRDFKLVSSYSLTSDLMYSEVGPGGELTHGQLGEAVYTNQAKTYGRILAVTRTDLINDDLGALMRVPQKLGRGAALKICDVVWSTFLSGVGSFWSAGNGNLITGATSTLTAVGLQAALLKFRQQTDPNGKPLGISPSVLLVPPELEIPAASLMNSQFFNTGGASTVSQVPSANVWQGSYRLASSTYLSNSTYTGNSALAWWLLAANSDLPTIELCVLNGREVPIIEQAEADFDQLGIQVRGFHDFGAALQEPRGSVRSAGA